jgi:hypothetical protein
VRLTPHSVAEHCGFCIITASRQASRWLTGIDSHLVGMRLHEHCAAEPESLRRSAPCSNSGAHQRRPDSRQCCNTNNLLTVCEGDRLHRSHMRASSGALRFACCGRVSAWLRKHHRIEAWVLMSHIHTRGTLGLVILT